MSTTMRIMGVQMYVAHDLDENLRKIEGYIKLAGGKADLVLFPEMALTGYHGDFDQAQRTAGLEIIAAACRTNGVAAAVGAGNKTSEGTYIELVAFSSDGEQIGSHSKIVPTNGDRKWCIPGQELKVFEYMGVPFGMLICNDLWVTPGCGPYPDPRLTYQLGQRGAKLVLHAINSGHKPEYIPYHESNLALRARESRFHIATANAVQQMDQPVNAATGVVSPDGNWLAQANRVGEGHYVAEIEIPG
jgi:NAD+ synthase (glutamine-hydrolysing)